MAAATRTVPILVRSSRDAERIAYVVPKEVEQREAPAVNAVRGVIVGDQNIGMRIKDNAIGRRMPVKATRTEMMKYCLSNFKSVLRPPDINQLIRGLPSYTRRISPIYPNCTIVRCTSTASQDANGPHIIPMRICMIKPHEKSLSNGQAAICRANRNEDRGSNVS